MLYCFFFWRERRDLECSPDLYPNIYYRTEKSRDIRRTPAGIAGLLMFLSLHRESVSKFLPDQYDFIIHSHGFIPEDL